jgi:hypothetical protein
VAIHVLAQGFWDLHNSMAIEEVNMTFDDIKALCICKLKRTRCDYNAMLNADCMDTGEENENKSTKAAASRWYMCKLRVSCLLDIGHQSPDSPTN